MDTPFSASAVADKALAFTTSDEESEFEGFDFFMMTEMEIAEANHWTTKNYYGAKFRLLGLNFPLINKVVLSEIHLTIQR